jgi:hypothetical protein
MPLATTRRAARHAGNQGLRSASHGFAEEITNMDGQQFDAWTRLLTRGMSRRGTLKTIVAVALCSPRQRQIPGAPILAFPALRESVAPRIPADLVPLRFAATASSHQRFAPTAETAAAASASSASSASGGSVRNLGPVATTRRNVMATAVIRRSTARRASAITGKPWKTMP